MGRATVKDPEFLKELAELRQKHPSPYIGLFIVKDSEEAKKKGKLWICTHFVRKI